MQQGSKNTRHAVLRHAVLQGYVVDRMQRLFCEASLLSGFDELQVPGCGWAQKMCACE